MTTSQINIIRDVAITIIIWCKDCICLSIHIDRKVNVLQIYKMSQTKMFDFDVQCKSHIQSICLCLTLQKELLKDISLLYPEEVQLLSFLHSLVSLLSQSLHIMLLLKIFLQVFLLFSQSLLLSQTHLH